MIPDREPGVVREQGLVGAKELAYIRGVMDGGVEVGVVFGRDGLVEDRLRLGKHERGDEALLVGVAVGAGFDSDEEVGKALSKSGPCLRSTAHKGVQCRRGAGSLEVARERVEQVVSLELVQVENERADANAKVGRRVRYDGEGAEWERLQREAAVGLVGGADPAGGDAHGFQSRAWGP